MPCDFFWENPSFTEYDFVISVFFKQAITISHTTRYTLSRFCAPLNNHLTFMPYTPWLAVSVSYVLQHFTGWRYIPTATAVRCSFAGGVGGARFQQVVKGKTNKFLGEVCHGRSTLSYSEDALNYTFCIHRIYLLYIYHNLVYFISLSCYETGHYLPIILPGSFTFLFCCYCCHLLESINSWNNWSNGGNMLIGTLCEVFG